MVPLSSGPSSEKLNSFTAMAVNFQSCAPGVCTLCRAALCPGQGHLHHCGEQLWLGYSCLLLPVGLTKRKMKHLLGVFSFISFSHQHLSFPNRKLRQSGEVFQGPRTCWALHTLATPEDNSLWVESGHPRLQLSPAMGMSELQGQGRRYPSSDTVKVMLKLQGGRQDTAQPHHSWKPFLCLSSSHRLS